MDLLIHVETALDHPVEKVWPHVLHWNQWVDDYLEHRIAGVPDVEGEIKSIEHFDETGRMDASYFAKVIRIVPRERLIYKILSPSCSYDATTGVRTEMPLTGYDIFNLRSEGGGTILTVEILADMVPAGVAHEQLQHFCAEYTAKAEKAWYERYLPRLKELLSSVSSGEGLLATGAARTFPV
jgi:hypothetical protein